MRGRARTTANTAQTEAYRILRSNLHIALLDLDRRSVLVTSARAEEGKTSTTVNLARALAVAGHRVVLVDMDLRHPDAHHWLGGPNDVGVTDVLTRRRSLRECMQFVHLGENDEGLDQGLYFLPTGPMVPNPTELLSSSRTPAFLEALTNQADIVLVDAPPVLPVADALVIGRMVGGAVLVVETRQTPLGAVQQAKDALTRNQTRLLGVVVNKLQPKDARSDQGYGYGYEYPHVATGRRSRRRMARKSRVDDGQATSWPLDVVDPRPTAHEPGRANGHPPAPDIDFPWPTASEPTQSEPTVVSGELPPMGPPAGPLSAPPRAEGQGTDHDAAGRDTGVLGAGEDGLDGARPAPHFGRPD